jgi:hypothetical protein
MERSFAMATAKAPKASKPASLGLANHPSHYELNVSRLVKGRYEHLFATDARSITSRQALVNLLRIMLIKFPKPEYDIQAVACFEFRRYLTVDSGTGLPSNPAPIELTGEAAR